LRGEVGTFVVYVQGKAFHSTPPARHESLSVGYCFVTATYRLPSNSAQRRR